MRKFRLLLAAVLVSVTVGSCTSPTMPPYPTPDETKEKDPPPAPGLTLPDR